MVKVIILGLIGTVLSVVVRQIRPEMAVLVALAAGGVMLLYTIPLFSELIAGLEGVVRRFGLNLDMFGVVLKITALAYLCEFGVAACKDAGAESIGRKIELFGKTSIFLMYIPIISSIIGILYQMVQL